MRHLILTFTSKNTFTVSNEACEPVGQVSYLIGEDEQPHGFVFTTLEGQIGHRRMTISEAIKDVLKEDIQIQISPIV